MSCISQSISQCIAKSSSALQQAPPIKAVNQSPSSTPHLRRHSPSKLPQEQLDTSAPSYSKFGCTKDGFQHHKCPPSSLQSSCPSPSFLQSPLAPSTSFRQPLYTPTSSPRPSFLHSNSGSSQNGNNNNNFGLTPVGHLKNTSGSVCSGGLTVFEGSTPVPQQNHFPLWSGSHNRVARPFSASEPSSRVQSPSPSPTPGSFFRLCSPPPQNNYSSLANKPPHPRSTRVRGPHNHLDLHFDLPRAASAGSAFGDSLSDGRQQILSPPPIGVSVWTNDVATPKPRPSRYNSSSPFFSSALGSPTNNISPLPTSASSSCLSRRSSLSRSYALPSQNLRRSLSSSLEDRLSRPGQSNGHGPYHSWEDSGRRSCGFSSSTQGSFDQPEFCPISPMSGWSAHSSSSSSLSPGTGLCPSKFTPDKGTPGGQDFTNVPWSGFQELSNKCIRTEDSETTISSPVFTPCPPPLSSLPLITSPNPSDGQTEWCDPEPEEGNYRSQLICAHVAQPPPKQNPSSSCLAFSPLPDMYQHQLRGLTPAQVTPPSQIPQLQVQRAPQVTTPPLISMVQSTSPPRSSPLSFTHSSPSKQGNQKASYATTVNLQIAGSGRITSFSTAQVSLTQTLQGGVGPPEQGQTSRRVSINGLSPAPQNCNRL